MFEFHTIHPFAYSTRVAFWFCIGSSRICVAMFEITEEMTILYDALCLLEPIHIRKWSLDNPYSRLNETQRLVFRVLQSDELVPDNMAHVSAQAAHQIWYAIIETKDYSEFLFHDSEQYHSKGDVFRIVHLRRSIFCYYCSVRRLQQALGNAQHKKLRSYWSENG